MGTMTRPAQPPAKKHSPVAFWIAVGIVGLIGIGMILVGIGQTQNGKVAEAVRAVTDSFSSCRKASTWQPVDRIEDRWKDAVKVAESTPRMALAVQITKLQDLKRETEAVKMPDCAANAMKSLAAYQTATIDGFLSFLGKGEIQAGELMESAAKHRELYRQERNRLQY